MYLKLHATTKTMHCSKCTCIMHIEFYEENIVLELREVAWPRLATALKIAKEIHTAIGNECVGNDREALRRIVRHWLDNDPKASWRKLAESLLTQQLYRQHGSRIYSKYVSKGL